MLEPVYADVVDGHAEVRQIFRISRQGNIAGCFVTDGTLHRNDLVRVMRGGQVIADVRCGSLKRFRTTCARSRTTSSAASPWTAPTTSRKATSWSSTTKSASTSCKLEALSLRRFRAMALDPVSA